MFRKKPIVIAMLCLMLAGCQASGTPSADPAKQKEPPQPSSSGTQQPSTVNQQPPSSQPEPAKPVTFTTYTEKRYGYAVKYPADWTPGGSEKGDVLFVAPKGVQFMQPNGPSIRVFTTDYDPAKHLNMAPPAKEGFVGYGGWPYMKVETVADTTVKTAQGDKPAVLLTGGGEEKGTKFQGIGLYVYGTGHSIDLYCTAPQAQWAQWQPVCQEVIKSFVAGDMSKVNPFHE